jgi:hypothetical protein
LVEEIIYSLKRKDNPVKSLLLSGALAGGLALGLSACTDPYDPGQRALGGAAIGAASGAAIGAAAAGGGGAATGALVGGAVGAVAEVATTPPPPDYGYPPGRYVALSACGPGLHWVRSHHDRFGRLVLGHCAPR